MPALARLLQSLICRELALFLLGRTPPASGVSQGVDSLVTFPRKGSKERLFRELGFHFSLSKNKPSCSLTCDVSSKTALGAGGIVFHVGKLFWAVTHRPLFLPLHQARLGAF